MKKKFPFILALIFIVIIGVICIFIGSNFKRQNTLSDTNIEEQKLDNNIDNESTTTTDTKVEDDIELNVDDKTTNDSQSNNESQKNNIDVPANKVETSKNQESDEQVIVKDDDNKNNNESIPSNNNTSEDTPVIDEVPENNNEETSTPQVDQELERLKSLIKYKTSQECYEASIDISFQYIDNENFNHTACKSFAYKGELLGYRMLIYYKDGTTEYLDAIG